MLLSESSVGAGVRRIEAVTSGEAWALLDERARELDGSARRGRDAAQGAEDGAVAARRRAPMPDAERAVEGGVNVIVQPVDGLDARRAARALRPLQAAARAGGGRARLEGGRQGAPRRQLRRVRREQVSASDVVREAAAIVGGGGGGRPTMARAGGKDPEKLPDALAEAERLIVAAL